MNSQVHLPDHQYQKKTALYGKVRENGELQIEGLSLISVLHNAHSYLLARFASLLVIGGS